MNNSKYRADIDGLRAIAILIVILFHAFPKSFPGGFIGVDIFFVISGFLITTIILNGLNERTFSLEEFYIRRVKRIFPALILTLFFTILIGWFILLPDEYLEISKQVIGGSLFVDNFYFWIESSYFDHDSILKPLIHLWSLGVVEQFYLFWPVILVLFSRKVHPLILIQVICLASLTTSIYFAVTKTHNALNFYFPITIFWEMLFGAILAYSNVNTTCKKNMGKAMHNKIVLSITSLFAFFLIISAIFIFNGTLYYPGYASLIPVLGATLLIAVGNKALVNRYLLSNPIMIWLGLISYPLYLYHWPLLSFLRIYYGEYEPNIFIKIFLIFIAIICSWATYRFVEKPIRISKKNHIVKVLVGILAISGLTGALIYSENGFNDRFRDEQIFNNKPNSLEKLLSNANCVGQYKFLFTNFDQERDFCKLTHQITNTPVVIIGDSHAGVIYNSLVSRGVNNIIHLGRGSCPPISDVNPVSDFYKCHPTIQDLTNYFIKSDASLIILTGVFGRYFDGTYLPQDNQKDIFDKVETWFRALGKSRKSIVIILDNPTLPFQSSQCYKRPLDFKDPLKCSFSRSTHDQVINSYKALFEKQASKYKNISIIDPTKYFCDEMECYAKNSDGLLYSNDNNHLNMRGANFISSEILLKFRNILDTTNN